ncbi:MULTISPECIES: phosphoribosyltransferase-like protein [Acinetobacter]|uniref:phosphoribosyltransferase-like protein n=1 Tax=Acinetobacter TaxID=469 RepID=UPI0002D09988|nr:MULTISPECIES: hypothetical protein [Acinetobacter]ENX32965.1 hypothetical protein F890_00123 [Acinetobacter sp. CIP 64.7]MCU4324869.1 hypothetical protein [Acinetobacter schindleri]
MFQSDDQWKYFVDTGVWPKRNQFAPQEWITNFDSDEQRFARRLLEKFSYFSEDMVRQLFKSSFISLSKYVLKDKNDTNLSAREWEEFLNNLYILKVTGENPSDADSGFIFTRMSRDILGIPESRLLNSSTFIQTIQSNPKANFVFVDDFVGSGSQFVTLWKEQKIAEGVTFDSLYKSYSNHRFFYCPAICTKRGYDYIKSNCPVEVIPAHLYTDLHNALNPDSYIWRDFSKDGPIFIRDMSVKAGIPELNGGVHELGDGNKIVSWQGYLSLGLTLAFNHGWPDATLPLFYHSERDWKPLLKKGEL